VSKVHEPTETAPIYPDDLEPALQDALAILANIDAHYDSERERLDQWVGPHSVKERLRAQLAEVHRQEREPHVQRLAELHQRWTTMRLFRQTIH
jgi:hypothetical protein